MYSRWIDRAVLFRPFCACNIIPHTIQVTRLLFLPTRLKRRRLWLLPSLTKGLESLWFN